jgi:hypothetical protein
MIFLGSILLGTVSAANGTNHTIYKNPSKNTTNHTIYHSSIKSTEGIIGEFLLQLQHLKAVTTTPNK